MCYDLVILSSYGLLFYFNAASFEVLSVPHRFLLDSSDSGGIQCIPEEWKLAEGSANTAILVVSHSGGILAFQN